MARILVVEDEANQRQVMRLALERSGHVVVEAEDAMAAKAICGGTTTPIDLLICDIGLPDLNGTELIKWFKDARPGVPVMAVTGESMADIEEPIAAAWYGTRRVFGKPFSTSDLTTAVAELLDSATLPHRTQK